jgi:hypothetical protein
VEKIMQSIRFEQLTTEEIIRYATLNPELVTVSDILEMAKRLDNAQHKVESMTLELED